MLKMCGLLNHQIIKFQATEISQRQIFGLLICLQCLLFFSMYFYSQQERGALLTAIQIMIAVERHYSRDAGQVQ